MSIRISCIQPSYKRSVMSSETFKEWVGHADRPEEIEYIIALDSIDPTTSEYQEKFSTLLEIQKLARFEISVGDSTNANQAMNRGAKISSSCSELIVVLADDEGCFPHWDTELFKLLEGVDNFKDPKLIWANDGYWQWGTIITAYFANRAFYNKLGYVINEEYPAWWGDNDLMETAKALNVIIPAPHLTFLHRHYTKGYCPIDETYARRSNQKTFDQGQEIFLKRKARNFDL